MAFQYRTMASNPKDLANEHFNQGQFDAACQMYSELLDYDPTNEVLLANRSAAFLEMGQFKKALQDAKKVMASQPTHVKARYIAAKAYSWQKRYDKAIEMVNSIDYSHLNVAEENMLVTLKAKFEVYLNQQKNGEYDLLAILFGGVKQYHDVADYIGPVKLIQVDGKGRGDIAEEDIQAGQLIMASKAFAISFDNDDTHSCLFTEVENALERNPDRKPELFKLYVGREYDLMHETLKTRWNRS